MQKWIRFVISLILPILIGFTSSLFGNSNINGWYLELNKPFFNPPNWIFGPVWIILYLMMGCAFYLVWTNKNKINKDIINLGMFWFGLQLLLNFFWTIFFFYMQNPLLAFIDIILLWISILFTIIWFYKINKSTIYLLLPYLLWVSFALILNLAIIIIN